MLKLKLSAFLAASVACSMAYASDAGVAASAPNASASACANGMTIARFELKIAQDGKTEADLMASPAFCGPGSRVGFHHIPSTPVDVHQITAENALDVELTIEQAGHQSGAFLVSLETKHLDASHPIQTVPGVAIADTATRSWSGMIALKPGEEMTLLKDGGQVATMRRVQ